MATVVTRYVCQQCGQETAKWAGQCPHCAAWNSLQETLVSKKSLKAPAASGLLLPESAGIILQDVQTASSPRIATGFGEFDRVLGGGIVPGSAILVGGEPGIGKSTLLLQVLLQVGGVYVSAEESAHQIKLRADRIAGGGKDRVTLIASNRVDAALAQIDAMPTVPLIIIDSIQTVASDDLDGVPGSIGQVRECANRIVSLAKRKHIPVIIVSHVTKEGAIAGPKALEHVVDVVIYIEGEELSSLRLVRGTKNRLGAVNEVGLFSLEEGGMRELLDTSLLLEQGKAPSAGSAITVAMEGARPMLLEVQALTVATSFGLPRRTANGMDYNRLLMLLAVTTKRTSLGFGNQDVYTNIGGGIRVRETALDLSVCLALASSMYNQPLPPKSASFGEVGLSGDIRPVMGAAKRVEQAKKLGYTTLFTAETVTTLSQAITQAFPQRPRRPASATEQD